MSANVSQIRRISEPLNMFFREYYRNPMNLVLLAAIPILLILSFGNALSRLADIFEVVLTKEMGQSMGALWSAAFLTGLTGFFMMIGARDADRRLVRAGYSPMQVVLLRFAAVGLLGGLATLVSFSMLLTRLTPTSVVGTLVIMYLAALQYGALGILIGSLMGGELEGSFALLFFFVMDAFIGSPLFGGASGAFAFLPNYYPTKVLLALTADQPHDPIHWLYVAVYLTIASFLAAWAFFRVARIR